MARCEARLAAYSRRLAGGYTLIQILVVLLIIGVMVVAFGYGAIGKVDSAKATTAKSVLASEVPKAFYSYLRVNGVPYRNTDVTAGLVRNGLSAQTPWGDNWSAKMVGRNPNAGAIGLRLRIRYPMGGDHRVQTAKQIVAALKQADKFPQVFTASIPSAGVVYVYYNVAGGA